MPGTYAPGVLVNWTHGNVHFLLRAPRDGAAYARFNRVLELSERGLHVGWPQPNRVDGGACRARTAAGGSPFFYPFVGWLGGLAVFGRALEAGEMRTLARCCVRFWVLYKVLHERNTTVTQAAWLGSEQRIEQVFAQGRRAQAESLCDFYSHVVDGAAFDAHAPHLSNVEVVFSTWGMPNLSPAQWDRMPALRAVFYAAGTVQGFARPLLERGVVVVSAWHANAVPVAEFTVAQTLLACKGFFRSVSGAGHTASPAARLPAPGAFGETVAILGVGAIGRRVIEMLRPFALRVVVFDPFLSETDAASLGVEKVTLAEAFAQGYVVSNHLADNAETRGLLDGALLASLRSGATFLNTGRGATVREDEFARVLAARPDLTALLDVTDPEPPAPDSPLLALPNVHMTPHIAGAIGDEVVRMADFMLDEFGRWRRGEALRYGVSLAMLDRMA